MVKSAFLETQNLEFLSPFYVALGKWHKFNWVKSN